MSSTVDYSNYNTEVITGIEIYEVFQNSYVQHAGYAHAEFTQLTKCMILYEVMS